MTSAPTLILFDVDGTLVDSQASIVAAMTAAFDALSQPVPERGAILGIVGLSLDHGIARLAPDLPRQTQTALTAAYKAAFHAHRLQDGAADRSPLYPGARAALEALAARPDTLLGVATGKSRRGLDALLEMHDLTGFFISCQVADDHPSKPHPSMIEAALLETGAGRESAVMIGDTTYDMQMAREAGVPGIAVSWGYHAPEVLRDHADCMIDRFSDLPSALAPIWGAVE